MPLKAVSLGAVEAGHPIPSAKEHGCMPISYDLTQLDAHSFEHMINFLALKVLGQGVTGFSQGADGGRDGYLIGEAPYPTSTDRWHGKWFIQCKFHKPHLSKNPQKWLINEVRKEIEAFENSEGRSAPDIWIIATNIEPSGNSRAGAYDSIKRLVEASFGSGFKFDIWGGRKVLDFLGDNPAAASYYGHFLTPGNVLTALYEQIGDSFAQIKTIVNCLILDQFNDQIYTKLEQAGSLAVRPKIHELFVDLPAYCGFSDIDLDIMETLVATSANAHRPTVWKSFGEGWRDWANVPKRARVIVLKGGPGQGKSTAGQFYSQVQRAALILEPDAPLVMPDVLEVANEFMVRAGELNFKPSIPRIPVTVELKDFATWYGGRKPSESKGVIAYLCERLAQKIDQKVEGGTLKRAFALRSWFFNFDGLDEVPNDVKDDVAYEITRLVNTILPELDADVLVLCTTRPQGYSGQFEQLRSSMLELTALPPVVALKCAEGVIRFGRTEKESADAVETLNSAMASPQVRELMTTPLQSHIMAIVVRDGGRPPEKRWELFDNFYQIMKKRESLKNFPDVRISQLLRENGTLLKAIHARLGVMLHARAETSQGADTSLERAEFCELARQTTERYVEENVDDLVETLMEATVERLVFVNTPESSTTLRFDIRQLQEFFAGEFIYSNVDPAILRSRLEVIGGDSHWREVMHFTISALVVNMRPTELAIALEVICAIDDSDTSYHIRILRRRMGVGAILALRLLSEGVLEQDKIVRSKFKEALSPIYAMLDSEILGDIASISHSNSMAFLLNCMIDALFEYSEPEQIGAAVALAMRLPDNHVRRASVSSKIFDSSSLYIQRIFRSLLSHHFRQQRGGGIESSDWFLEGAVKLVMHDNPKGYDLVSAIRYIRLSRRVSERLAGFGLAAVELKLFKVLLENDESYDELRKQGFEREGITFAARKHNWHSKSYPDSFNFDTTVVATRSPILMMVAAVVEFSKKQRIEDLRKVLVAHLEYSLGDEFLSAHTQALLPIKFEVASFEAQVLRLDGIDQSILDEALISEESDVLDLPRLNLVLDMGSIDGWSKIKQISSFHPELAISLWLQSLYFSRVRIVVDTEAARLFFYELAKLNPQIMLMHFSSWGEVFELLPEYELELRSIFLKHVGFYRPHFERSEQKPFLIRFPEEIEFLPLVVQAALSKRELLSYGGVESVCIRDMFQSYGMDDDFLESIYRSSEYTFVIRAAALSCYMTRAEDEDNTVEHDFFVSGLDELAIEFSEQVLPAWYLGSLIFALECFDHKQLLVMEFVGKILYNYRENYSARVSLQELLSKWRERSSAPVNTREVLTRWLNE